MAQLTGTSMSARQVRLDAARACDRAVRAVLSRQRADGSWLDHLPSAAISTATSVVALHHADPDGSQSLIQGGLDWLRRCQLPGGGWGDGPGEPPTLPATSIAVAALALLDPAGSAADIRRALGWIEGQGGMAAVADPGRCALHVLCLQYLALAGLYDQDRIKRMPVTVGLLPRGLRRKVSFVVPVTLSWAVMQRHTWQLGPVPRLLSRLAEPRAFRYFDELTALEPPGGGSQESPLLVSMVCFALARAGQRPDLVRRGVEYLRSSARPDGSWAINRDLAFSVTAFVATGLADCGLGDDPRLSATLHWIRSSQWRSGFPPTGCPAGGWAWSPESGWPNTDDTANALAALAAFGHRGDDPQVAAGLRWLLAMQNRDGSWSCFCRNNHVALDAPCSVITAHALTALRLAGGMTAASRPVARALRWYARAQRPDGSLGCLWYRDSTAGTARTLDVLGGFGLGQSQTAQGCLRWLSSAQNPDGGWGDGTGAPSSAEETAWALTGLLSVGLPPEHPAVTGAVRWLVAHQAPDGMWTPTRLGVYFLDLWYSDDMLAAGYVMQALGRYLDQREA